MVVVVVVVAWRPKRLADVLAPLRLQQTLRKAGKRRTILKRPLLAAISGGIADMDWLNLTANLQICTARAGVSPEHATRGPPQNIRWTLEMQTWNLGTKIGFRLVRLVSLTGGKLSLLPSPHTHCQWKMCTLCCEVATSTRMFSCGALVFRIQLEELPRPGRDSCTHLKNRS